LLPESARPGVELATLGVEAIALTIAPPGHTFGGVGDRGVKCPYAPQLGHSLTPGTALLGAELPGAARCSPAPFHQAVARCFQFSAVIDDQDRAQARTHAARAISA